MAGELPARVGGVTGAYRPGGWGDDTRDVPDGLIVTEGDGMEVPCGHLFYVVLGGECCQVATTKKPIYQCGQETLELFCPVLSRVIPGRLS